jgi:hypothetical protein
MYNDPICRTGPLGYILAESITRNRFLVSLNFNKYRAGIFKQSMGARNRVGIGLPYRARICRRLWTLRHRFQESIPNEILILTWTWDMGTSISNLFPNRFQESIFHPLTRLQIPALVRQAT